MSTPQLPGIEPSRAAKMLREVFDSGRPLTYIRSTEEQRIARVLHEVSLHLLIRRYAGLDLEPHRGHATRR